MFVEASSSRSPWRTVVNYSTTRHLRTIPRAQSQGRGDCGVRIVQSMTYAGSWRCTFVRTRIAHERTVRLISSYRRVANRERAISRRAMSDYVPRSVTNGEQPINNERDMVLRLREPVRSMGISFRLNSQSLFSTSFFKCAGTWLKSNPIYRKAAHCVNTLLLHKSDILTQFQLFNFPFNYKWI